MKSVIIVGTLLVNFAIATYWVIVGKILTQMFTTTFAGEPQNITTRIVSKHGLVIYLLPILVLGAQFITWKNKDALTIVTIISYLITLVVFLWCLLAFQIPFAKIIN